MVLPIPGLAIPSIDVPFYTVGLRSGMRSEQKKGAAFA